MLILLSAWLLVLGYALVYHGVSVFQGKGLTLKYIFTGVK